MFSAFSFVLISYVLSSLYSRPTWLSSTNFVSLSFSLALALRLVFVRIFSCADFVWMCSLTRFSAVWPGFPVQHIQLPKPNNNHFAPAKFSPKNHFLFICFSTDFPTNKNHSFDSRTHPKSHSLHNQPIRSSCCNDMTNFDKFSQVSVLRGKFCKKAVHSLRAIFTIRLKLKTIFSNSLDECVCVCCLDVINFARMTHRHRTPI